MKVIIQLSGLGGRLEDTERGQKPVQLLTGPGQFTQRALVSGKADRRVRETTDSEYSGSGQFDLQRNPLATRTFIHVAVRLDKLVEREDPGLER